MPQKQTPNYEMLNKFAFFDKINAKQKQSNLAWSEPGITITAIWL